MSKLRKFLLKLIKPKGLIAVYCYEASYHEDKQYGRHYIDMGDGLRLYFEDGEYVGFSTKMPFISSNEANNDNT